MAGTKKRHGDRPSHGTTLFTRMMSLVKLGGMHAESSRDHASEKTSDERNQCATHQDRKVDHRRTATRIGTYAVRAVGEEQPRHKQRTHRNRAEWIKERD